MTPRFSNRNPQGRTAVASTVAKGSAASLLAQFLYLGTRFFLTPFVVLQAGFAAYGFWSILFATLGLLGVHRMGFIAASVSFYSRRRAEGRNQQAVSILRTTATCALIFAVAVGIPLVAFTDDIVRWMGAGPDLAPAAVTSLRITTLATLVALVLGGYQTALEGAQKYVRVKSAEASVQLLEAGLVVVFLYQGLGLVGLALAYAIRMLLAIPLHAWSARREGLAVRAFPGHIDRSEVRALLSFGGAVQGLGALHLAVASIPRIAMAHVLGLATAGIFELGRKLIDFTTGLAGQAFGPIVPAAAELGAHHERSGELVDMLRSATRFTAFLAAIPLSVLFFFPDAAILAWLGEADGAVAQTLTLLAPAAWIHVCTGPLTSVLRGLARPRFEIAYAALWLLLAATSVPWLANTHGLIGGATGFAASQAIACTALFALARGSFSWQPTELLRDLLLPAFYGAAGPLVAYMLAPTAPATRWDGLAHLTAAGLCSMAIGLPLAWRFVLRPSDRTLLADRWRESHSSPKNAEAEGTA